MGALPQPISRSPPKLTLSSLPKREPPPGLVTPPLQPMVSVPFMWEEAPGRPRAFPVPPTSSPAPSKPKAARSLDLPPRLLIPDGGKGTNTPSPTTVLDGPYSGGGRNTLAHTMSFTFGKGSFRMVEGKKRIGKERVNFSSLRWEEESFKENYDCESGGVLDLSPSLGVFQEDFAAEPPKITTRKRSSFFGSSKSNFWTSIYESVKQAVPWRRRQEKTRRMNY